MKTITAQKMYDAREKFEFCSGNDLHEFFEQTTGDPSPSGKREISDEQAFKFVVGCLRAMWNNSPGTARKLTMEIFGAGTQWKWLASWGSVAMLEEHETV